MVLPKFVLKDSKPPCPEAATGPLHDKSPGGSAVLSAAALDNSEVLEQSWEIGVSVGVGHGTDRFPVMGVAGKFISCPGMSEAYDRDCHVGEGALIVAVELLRPRHFILRFSLSFLKMLRITLPTQFIVESVRKAIIQRPSC